MKPTISLPKSRRVWFIWKADLRRRHQLHFVAFALLMLHFCGSSYAQGTALTYQGQLMDQGAPATGIFDLQFSFWDSLSAGFQAGNTVQVDDVTVSNGLFTVTVDPGAGVFRGSPRWVEIGVRPGPSNGVYTTVLPRQAVLASPYAILAGTISGTISGGQVFDGSMSGSKLADNAVTTTKLNDLSVTTSKLADGAVTSIKIATGAVASSQLAANSVSGPKIVDNSITAIDIDPISFATTFWRVVGNAGTTAGTHFLGTTDDEALEVKVNNQRALRVEPTIGTPNLVGGYVGNYVSNSVVGGAIGGGGSVGLTNRVLDDYGTVAGGHGNLAGLSATVGGGSENVASSSHGTVGGGERNEASGTTATVSGGYANKATSLRSAVSGGELNTASGASAIIAGGDNNLASGFASAIGGGEFHVASGNNSTIPGGSRNNATNYAFAAGRMAKATNNGAFVWADSIGTAIGSTNNNSVTMRATGGYRLYSNMGATLGVFLAPSGNSWSAISDRDAKKNFQPVDGKMVLEKLARVPVQKWNYKSEADDEVQHLGPMAQDFKAAFYPGRDERSISTLEFDGVELAAIQGLNQKLNEEVAQRNSRVTELELRNAALEKRLAALEKMLKTGIR